MKTNASSQACGIRVEDGMADHTSTHGIMAVFLLGAAGLIVWHFKLKWNFNPDSRDFNPMVIAPLVLGAMGLRFLVPAVLGTLRGRRFGQSVLEIEGPPVRMGGTMRGKITTSAAIHPLSDFEITLRCIETFAIRSDSDSSDTLTKNIDHVRWESTVRAAPAAVRSTEGIPFEITLPEPFEPVPDIKPDSRAIVRGVVALNLPGGRKIFSHNQKPVSTHWMLLIRAPVKGVDYQARFCVDVADHVSAR